MADQVRIAAAIEPAAEELGERLNLSATKVRRLLGLAREPRSLEGWIEERGGGDRAEE